jgi:hypothetical protein
MTPEQAMLELIKSQAKQATSREDSLRALVSQSLTNHPLGLPATEGVPSLARGYYESLPTPQTMSSLAEQLAFWKPRFPNTVQNLTTLEHPVSGALAHFRPVSGGVGDVPRWAMGVPDTLSAGEINEQASANQLAGFLANNEKDLGIRSIWNHEFGHALDYSLNNQLMPGSPAKTVAAEAAGIKLNNLKAQLIQDALRGKVSGYAQREANKILPQAMREQLGGHPLMMTADDIKSWLHPQTINQIAKEPFAESFAANPAMLNDVEAAARTAGWRGAAEIGAMGKGAGLGAALLAAPLIASHVHGTAGQLLQGASTGAGIGGMLGPEGALAGAGIGALASQLFK